MYRMISKHAAAFAIIGAMCMAVKGAAAAPAEEAKTIAPPKVEVSWSNEFTATMNDVTGPGWESSGLRTGTNYLNVFRYDYKKTWGERTFSFGTGFNVSTDKSVDPKSINMTRLEMKYSLPRHNWTLGDISANYSPYSFSGSVKGASYQYADPTHKSTDLSFVYGIAYPRWDNFWSSEESSLALQRKTAALRLNRAASKFDWGFNAVMSEDTGRVSSSDTLYNNLLFAADWQYRPDEFWILDGEHSRSGTAYSPGQDEDYQGLFGWAHRFSAVRSAGRQRFSFDYEHVTPNFTTLMGSASVDREKVKVTYRDRLTRESTWRTTLLWFRDNLDWQKSYATQTFQPELGVSFGRFLKRENANLDLAVRMNLQTYLDGYVRDTTTVLGYKDRFGVIDADLNMEFSAYDTLGSSRSFEFMHNLTLTTSVTRGQYTLTPTLYLGFWRSQEALSTYYRDERWESSLGLAFSHKKSNLSGQVKFGQNRLLKTGGGDSSEKWFSNVELRWKPPFLTKKFRSGSLYLKWLMNDYLFDTTTRNYRENSFIFGFNVEY